MSRSLPGLPAFPPSVGAGLPAAAQEPAGAGASGRVGGTLPPPQRPAGVGLSRPEVSTGEFLATIRSRPTPSRRSLAVAALLLFVLTALWWSRRPHWPGPVQLAEPVQTEVQAQPLHVRGFTILPQASFEVEGVVVGRERYRVGREAKLSPYDVGVVWGIAAQPDLLRVIRYSQNSRFLWWRFRGDLPVGEDEMNRSMANIHTIPSSSRVRRQLRRLRAGQVVRLTGFLVRVEGEGGWQWNSSMTREDTGNGACEVMLVQGVERVERRVSGAGLQAARQGP